MSSSPSFNTSNIYNKPETTTAIMEPNSDEASLHVKQSVVSGLRTLYPWMKDAAVEEIAVKCYGAIREGIEEQGPVMLESKAQVGLLSLPAELRNRIYELVLINPGDDNNFHEEGIIHVCNSCGVCWEWNRQPSLTRSCRTIRSETLSIYYACNHFRYVGAEAEFSNIVKRITAGSDGGGVSWAVRSSNPLGGAGDWLRAMGTDNAALIRDFEVKIAGLECGWGLAFDPAPAPYAKLAPHVATISAVLLDHLRREDIPLPGCTRVLAYEDGDYSLLQHSWGEERTWKQLALPLLEGQAGGKAWEMIV